MIKMESKNEIKITEEKIYYKSLDGLDLCGILATPNIDIKGYVLLAHGITVDKDEGGFYADIAAELCKKGYASLRFDFRAHGESSGKQREMTIIGELVDVKASVKKLFEYGAKQVGIIAASFGAGPVILYTATNNDKVGCIVLLNPVIDYSKTFLNPIVPWAKESFNDEGYKNLYQKGYLLLDGIFEIGIKLVEEFQFLTPYTFMKQIMCPVLTIHGDKDSMVPFQVSKKHHKCNKKSSFITIFGADHGFIKPGDELLSSRETKEYRAHVIKGTVSWVEKYLRQ